MMMNDFLSTVAHMQTMCWSPHHFIEQSVQYLIPFIRLERTEQILKQSKPNYTKYTKQNRHKKIQFMNQMMPSIAGLM